MKKLMTWLLVLAMVFSLGGIQPVSAASTLGPVASPATKKGLIVKGSWPDTYSSTGLNLSHEFYNLVLNNVLSTEGTQENYTYNGQTYQFQSPEYATGNTWRWTWLRAYQERQKGMAITVELLLSWPTEDRAMSYVYPDARQEGKMYYALDASTPEAQNRLGALFHYLVAKMPWVNNWIIGNEINSGKTWNFTGHDDAQTNAIIARQSYDLMTSAIADESPNAKAYICLDNIWNRDNPDGVSSRDFLDAFASLEGNSKNWNLAFHPGPVPTPAGDNPSDWALWKPKPADWMSYDDDTKYLTAANLDVLTDHIRNNFGSNHRVIVTEFSYDYRMGGDAQAASLLYTYEAAERNSMIDECIYQPWQDDPYAAPQTCGLVETDEKETRPAFTTFKYMNTDLGAANSAALLDTIGISKWTDPIIYGKVRPKSTTPYASYTRLAGGDRYATAAAIAQAAYPNGVKTAVLVSGESFADALSASAYAGSISAPILLSGRDYLPDDTAGLLSAWGVTKVVIIGGESAVSKNVDAALASRCGIPSGSIRRISGESRYMTALMVEEAIQSPADACVVAYGEGFADALSVSPWCYQKKMPILLMGKDIDAAAIVAAEKYHTVYVIGGVISTDFDEALQSVGVNVIRLAGDDRYETTVKVAQTFADGYQGAYLANGENFPDALAGSAAAGIMGRPIILVNSNDTNNASAKYIRGTFPETGVTKLVVLGGNGAVSDTAANYLSSKDA